MNLLFEMINSIACIIFIVINTIFWGSVSVTSVVYSPSGRVAHFCMRWWSKTTLWFCRVKVDVDGLEHVSRDRVQIFASNHASHFDIFVLSAVLPVKFGWVSKKILFFVPFLGWHMKLQGYVSIDRGNRASAIKSLDEAAEKIKGGNRIAIFPEGTRTRSGELQPFKKGLFHLCVKTGVPIVPIFINGTYGILRPESLAVHPATVYVKIGSELPTAGYSPERIEDLMNDLMARFIELRKEAEEKRVRWS
ncbi:MAG TPA: lysophospholipid acyltransferase family protein [Spirochaetota bacterium]|nr:lysophospholipid acyltransferase family protein [Spirochaetota bacterium]